jgi:SET domain-containing protein
MEKVDATNEFSFRLKPSEHGIGVFAMHDISKGTHLRLFGDGEHLEDRSRALQKKSVPEEFQDFCMYKESNLVCPGDFGVMPIGWYLNHSFSNNAYHKDYQWYASRDIKAGEEILIDYNSLGEPEEQKDEYYKRL